MKLNKKLVINSKILELNYELKKEANERNSERESVLNFKNLLEITNFLITNMKHDDLLLINLFIGLMILLFSK